MTASLRPLTPVEARVLGTLMEKARTVPDSYPLSMQALLTGCNQKTTRDPVMNLAESQVAEAIDELKGLALVVENSGARVPRYSHNFMRGVGVPEQSAVLLGLLMLRGPQTAGELRINSERWYRFADISSVDAFLEELQDRSAEKGGPLVVKLPKAPVQPRAALGAPAVRRGGHEPARRQRGRTRCHRRRRDCPHPPRGHAGGRGGRAAADRGQPVHATGRVG
jgi:uncharacterized protein YceH (UPF0502 family)